RRCVESNTGEQALLGALEGAVIEEFVLLDRAAQACTVLLAIEDRRGIADLRRSSVSAIVKEALPVDFVGAGTCGYIHRTGRGELGGEVEAGLADLEFLDRVDRDVLSRGAYCFIGNIQAVYFNASRASEAATEGNRGEALLRRIEVSAVLNLDSRL